MPKFPTTVVFVLLVLLQACVRMSGDLKARELAQYDDVASSLCVDPMVGFTTHKMNPRFRHVKGR